MKRLLCFILLSTLCMVAQERKELIAYIQIPASYKAANDFGDVKLGTRSDSMLLGFVAEERTRKVSFKLKLTGPFYFLGGKQDLTVEVNGAPAHVEVYFKPSLAGLGIGSLVIEGANSFQKPLKPTFPLSGVGRVIN